VTREPSDIGEDKADWEEDICDELEEMQEKADEEYQKKLEKYEQDIALWKEQKLQKVCTGNMMSYNVLAFFTHSLDFGPSVR